MNLRFPSYKSAIGRCGLRLADAIYESWMQGSGSQMHGTKPSGMFEGPDTSKRHPS
jgi:hypothetical protein